MTTWEDLRQITIQLLLGIDVWAADEDGIPECCWDAYEAARAAIGHPLVIATVNGWEGRYQSLKGALEGEPWPPPEEADPEEQVLYKPPCEGLASGYVQAKETPVFCSRCGMSRSPECDTLGHKEDPAKKISRAIALAKQYGGIDGSHHKQWIIDQMKRILLGPDYDEWQAQYNEVSRRDGYGEWDEGIAP